MNNFNPRRKLLLVAASGAAGFFLLLLAIFIFIFVSLTAVGFPFGGGSPSFGESLILYGLVPLIISFGAGLPAWALGANFWQGFLAGAVAMGIFVLIEFTAGRISDYGLLSVYETLAFIIAVLTVVLIVIIKIHRLPRKIMAVLFALGAVLIGLRFILPNESIAGGVIALMAWILLPLTAASLAISQQTP